MQNPLTIPNAMFLALVALSPPASGAEDQPALATLQRLHVALRPVFLRHYPKATSAITAEGVHFEADTRVFLIHIPLKTGEWQEAREVRGPNRQGILCNIRLVEGLYEGQASLPQTFDERYFSTLVMAVSPPSQEQYLYVHLSYPDGVSPGFLKDFTDVLAGFWSAARPSA